jgi:hypothetical protein
LSLPVFLSGGLAQSLSASKALERPKPEPPLEITPFLELIDQKVYACRSGNIAHTGASTTAVLLIFGPDVEEVAAVNGWLNAALLDQIRWQQTEGPPAD